MIQCTLAGSGEGLDDVTVLRAAAAREVLQHRHADVRVIEVGKPPGHHPVPQAEINRILVDARTPVNFTMVAPVVRAATC